MTVREAFLAEIPRYRRITPPERPTVSRAVLPVVEIVEGLSGLAAEYSAVRSTQLLKLLVSDLQEYQSEGLQDLSDAIRRLAAEYEAQTSDERFANRFRSLVRHWQNDTEMLSSFSDAAMHPAYQQIIGMGPAVIPLILEDMKANGGSWFWALRALSGEDPVPPEARGNVKEMKSAWLKWGEDKGYA